MYLADTTVLSKVKYPEIFEQMEKNLRLSKNLYNAALFRIRQVFTGWDKEVRTENEEEVFREVRIMQAAYPKVKGAACALVPGTGCHHARKQEPGFFCGPSHADSPAGPEGSGHGVQGVAVLPEGIQACSGEVYGKALHAEIPEGRQAHILYHEPGRGPVPCVQGDGLR